MAKEKWINEAIKEPGSLREALGVRKGKNIPKNKLKQATKKKGITGQRARLARTLSGLSKKKGN